MSAIGVFDSGLGGLHIAATLARSLPFEELIYLGDTARVPYGTRSPHTIIQYTLNASKFLLSKGIKLLVVACNTASAYALPILEKELGIPVIGMIEAGIEASKKSPNGAIAVLATPATIRAGTYEKSLQALKPHRPIYSVACPLLVPLVEAGWAEMAVSVEVARIHLQPLIGCGIEAALLGCTHYPIMRNGIREAFKSLLGHDVVLLDASQTVAQLVGQQLEKLKIAAQLPSHPIKHQLYTTDDPDGISKLAEIFWHQETALPLPKIELIDLG
jgi:glutamate racemase